MMMDSFLSLCLLVQTSDLLASAVQRVPEEMGSVLGHAEAGIPSAEHSVWLVWSWAQPDPRLLTAF